MITYEFIHQPVNEDPLGLHKELNEKVEEALKNQIEENLAPISHLTDQYDFVFRYNAIDKTSSIESSNIPDDIMAQVQQILKSV